MIIRPISWARRRVRVPTSSTKPFGMRGRCTVRTVDVVSAMMGAPGSAADQAPGEVCRKKRLPRSFKLEHVLSTRGIRCCNDLESQRPEIRKGLLSRHCRSQHPPLSPAARPRAPLLTSTVSPRSTFRGHEVLHDEYPPPAQRRRSSLEPQGRRNCINAGISASARSSLFAPYALESATMGHAEALTVAYAHLIALRPNSVAIAPK